MFDHSSDDHDESRSDNSSNNRDSKTSGNSLPLLEVEDTDDLNISEIKTNSYENLCVVNDRQVAVPLLEDDDDDVAACINNATMNTQPDFPRSSNTSLPRSQNSRSISQDEDYSKSSNISLPRSERSIRSNTQNDFVSSSNISLPRSEHSSQEQDENLQKDFVNSSNVCLPGSGKSISGSRRDLKETQDEAEASLLNDQDDGANFSTRFPGTDRQGDGGDGSLQTDV